MVSIREKIIKNIFIIIGFMLFIAAICNENICSTVIAAIKNELLPCYGDRVQLKLIYEFVPGIYSTKEDKCTKNWWDVRADQGEKIISEDIDVNRVVDATDTDISPVIENDEPKVTEETVTATIPPVNASIVYSEEQLYDFDYLVSNCYTVAASTSVNQDELNARELLDMDMTIDTSGEEYKVLIYHTHGSEGFVDSREGMAEDTVIGLGDELTNILINQYGIKTYHDRTAYDMVTGTLDRSKAYTYSGEAIDRILEQYPSIEVIIDLHRDGVKQSMHLVRLVDGRPTAQIMFLNGVSRTNASGELSYLYNPYKKENLSFSLKLHLAGKSLYGDLLRKNYISGYCFNLDRRPRATLIEVGAQTNTVEEAKNAMLPLAAILNEVLTVK